MRPHLSWSRRGRFFAYLDVDRPGNYVNQMMMLRVADGGSFPITRDDTHELAPSWSGDERALYFASNRGGASDVWLQGFREDGQPEGDPQPVTVGLEVQSLALSPDGTRFAYSKGRNVANVWRVPILGDRLATWSDAEQLTFGQAWAGYVDVSPDGKRHHRSPFGIWPGVVP